MGKDPRTSRVAFILRRRWPRLVGPFVALFTLAALVQGVPQAARASAVVGNKGLTQVDPAPFAPPLPQADRLGAPAPSEPQGITDPAVADFSLSGDPTKVLAGLLQDPKASSANANVYMINGVDRLVAVSQNAVNYQDASGNWVPIKTNLVPDQGGGLVNEANSFTVHFPSELSGTTPLNVEVAGGSYSFAPEGMEAPSALSQTNDTALTYPGVAKDTDLGYTLTDGGYAEAVVLDSPDASGSITFDLATTGLTLSQDGTGEVSILSGDQTVGLIPPPKAKDSSSDSKGEAAVGPATQTLQDLGNGSYTLALTVDEAFLARAKFPVVVDPPMVSLTPSRDTWVDEEYPTASYETGSNSDELRAGNAVTSYKRYSFLQFAVSGYMADNRVVQSAGLYLWPTYVADGSKNVEVQRVTDSWPAQGQLTWNNKPGVDSTVWATQSGGTGNPYYFDVTSLYRKIIDTTTGYGNHGVRLRGDPNASPVTANYHRFASSKSGLGSGAYPTLIFTYDDPPAAPALLSPADGKSLTYSSPTLRVNAPVYDQNGDPVWVNYQVSASPTDFSSPVIESGWQPDQGGWIVPAGNLLDGQTYYWRAQSWDVCNPDALQMCDLGGKPYPVSAVRSFTVSLNRFGDGANWAMWTDSRIANGMVLKVNEASGNLYLKYPIDSLATPVGPLEVALTYNSQDSTNNGLGQGWQISAGPASDPRQLPNALTEVDAGDQVRITMADGNQLFFPKRNASGLSTFYGGVGAGAGLVQKNGDGSYIYDTSDGGEFTFDPTGTLSSATPATTSVSGTTPGFSYLYSAGGHLESVTDPIGRTVTLTWNTADTQLQSVTTWDGRAWTVTYDGSSRLRTITSPVTQNAETVTFAYNDTPTRIITITDALNRATWIGYTSPGGTPPKGQVHTVADPGVGSSTQFDYIGALLRAGGQHHHHHRPAGNRRGEPRPRLPDPGPVRRRRAAHPGPGAAELHDHGREARDHHGLGQEREPGVQTGSGCEPDRLEVHRVRYELRLPADRLHLLLHRPLQPAHGDRAGPLRCPRGEPPPHHLRLRRGDPGAAVGRVQQQAAQGPA